MGCKAHPERVEARICGQCAAHWCFECPRKVGTREVCPDCGFAVQRYVAQHGVGEAVVDAVRRIMSLEGLFTAIAIAIPRVLGAYVWIFQWIYLASVAGYYFLIIRHVGDSRAGLPGPSDTAEDWNGTIAMALRGVICYAVGLVPLIVWIVLGKPLDLETIVALVLAGQLYMPAVVLSVALTNSTFGAVWPITWIQVISRAPGPYVRFVLMWFGTLLVAGGLSIAAALTLPTNLIGNFANAFLWCMFWFAQAVLVGNYIRENAAAFGWDEPAPSEPIVPVAIARGRATEQPPIRGRATASPPIGAPEHLRGRLAYAVATAELSAGGLDARREDNSPVLVMWRDVVGVVVRRLPLELDGVTFVDIVSLPGATLRILPWTRLTGETLVGEGARRARELISSIATRCPDIHLDRGTREFIETPVEALQLPDIDTLRMHDAKLA